MKKGVSGQWVVAAESSSDLSDMKQGEHSEEGETKAHTERQGSLESMMYMGAPPSQSPSQSSLGALISPAPLMNVMISPITKTHDNDEDF